MEQVEERFEDEGYPGNPVVVRVRRGDFVESVHRGAWVLVDSHGRVLEGAGRFDAPFFARSSIKSMQALPLLETGAAARHGLTESEVALAVSSHSGEPCHTQGVAALLERLSLSASALLCGSQVPADPETRFEMRRRDEKPTPLHNNCSGKHAGFLALCTHLGQDPAAYLDPAGESQVLVRSALAEMTDTDAEELSPALDGCSAPTYRLPLTALALGFARVTNPAGLRPARAAACARITSAVGAHPVLVAGSKERLCTDLARVTGGRLFPKIGAEAVYAVGEVGGGRAFAVKVDDGQPRGMHALVLALLERFGFLRPDELARLASWRDPVLRNWAGLEVGRIEPVVADAVGWEGRGRGGGAS